MKEITIATTFIFDSESSSKQYQTLQYTDGTTSCDCFGWTKRCINGKRSCKHTRFVEAGLGARHAVKVVEQSTPGRRTPQRASEPVLAGPRRRFDLEG